MRSRSLVVLAVTLVLLAAAGAWWLLRPAPPPVVPGAERTTGEAGPADGLAPPPGTDVPRTTVTGRVIRLGTERPVTGVAVLLAGLDATTGEDGRFSIGPVAPGPAEVELRAEGLPSWRHPVVVDPAAPDLGDLRLPSPTAIDGCVLDENGAGVSGATVRILERTVIRTGGWRGPAEDQIRMGIDVLDRNRPPPGIRLVTGPDGTFRLEGPAPGTYFLAARASGRASRAADVRVPESGEAEIVIMLGPAAALAGTVVDTAIGPVEGARVLAVPWRGAGRLPYERFLEGRSGPEGAFRLDGAREGEDYALFARAPDGKIGIAGGIEAPAEQVRLILATRGDVSGTVVDDETGKAIEGVRVFGVLGLARSDAEGRYRLEGFLRNPLLRHVWFEADGYEDHAEEIGLGASLLGGESLRVDVRLSRVRPGSLDVTVVDVAGRPVAGVEVTIFAGRESDGPRGSGITDANGRASLEGVPPRSVRVRAAKEGWVPVHTSEHPEKGRFGVVRTEAYADVKPGARSEIRITMSATGVLRGIVRDDGGEGIEGVALWVGRESGKTGADGRFEVEGVPTGAPLVVVALRHDGYVPKQELMRTDGPAEVVLARAGRVAGVVVDERGRPLGGAEVTMSSSNRGSWRRATTRPDGVFRLPVYEEEEVVLRATRDGFAPARSPAIRLAEGEVREGVRLRLVKGVMIRLTFEDAAGRDAAASFQLHGPLALDPGERARHPGGYTPGADPPRIRLTPGAYRILATPQRGAAGGAIEVDRVIGADADLRLTFPAEAKRIRLKVPADGAARMVSGSLERTEPEHPRVTQWLRGTRPGEIVESRPLPPGRYRVTVHLREGDRGAPRTRVIEDVEPGGDPIEVAPEEN